MQPLRWTAGCLESLERLPSSAKFASARLLRPLLFIEDSITLNGRVFRTNLHEGDQTHSCRREDNVKLKTFSQLLCDTSICESICATFPCYGHAPYAGIPLASKQSRRPMRCRSRLCPFKTRRRVAMKMYKPSVQMNRPAFGRKTQALLLCLWFALLVYVAASILYDCSSCYRADRLTLAFELVSQLSPSYSMTHLSVL